MEFPFTKITKQIFKIRKFPVAFTGLLHPSSRSSILAQDLLHSVWHQQQGALHTTQKVVLVGQGRNKIKRRTGVILRVTSRRNKQNPPDANLGLGIGQRITIGNIRASPLPNSLKIRILDKRATRLCLMVAGITTILATPPLINHIQTHLYNNSHHLHLKGPQGILAHMPTPDKVATSLSRAPKMPSSSHSARPHIPTLPGIIPSLITALKITTTTRISHLLQNTHTKIR